MPIEEIRSWLLSHPLFRALIDAVVHSGVLCEFPAIEQAVSPPEHNWHYLLLCASVLARSDIPDEQRVALRIADTCLKMTSTTEEEKAAAAVVLDVMANRRSVDLAIKRGLVPSQWIDTLPLPLRADLIRRSSEDVIATSDGQLLCANRFQSDFWNALTHGQWISASAPTSAGKSFLLRLWVMEVFRTHANSSVACIVPTRALIQEFSDSFASDQLQGLLGNVVIHTLPLDEEYAIDTGHLFILTQERLHILLGRLPSLSFDVLIIDEAQKVGDGYRGVLLEQVISECIRRSQETQIVYASPFSSNPGYLMRDAPIESSALAVGREVTTVTQNLLFVSQQRGDPLTWNISYVSGDAELPIGKVKLPFRPAPDSKRLGLVALALRSTHGGNMVYANGPADAEKVALHLADGFRSLGEPLLDTDQRIDDLVKLVRKAIHPKYALIETLKHGVAFHYGNMPLLIRTEIETLFRDNILRFLVCTATLIEGVNLPCKIIFLRGPTKGRGNPMNPVDFWNLAGRAGRWGKEFHGSIVCIDPRKPSVWKEPPPTSRVRQHIKAATEDALENTDTILEYIRDGYPIKVGHDHPEFDYTITFLLNAFLSRGNIDNLPSLANLQPSERESIRGLINEQLECFSLPQDFISRHPGILPHSLTQLLTYLGTRSDAELMDLVPVLPESDDAVDHYLNIFRIINEHLRANWAQINEQGERRLWQLALLAVEWMRGKPLAVLIRARERANERRVDRGQSLVKLSTLIIGVMRDVEEYARFSIPKYLRAYLDVLGYHATQRGLVDNIGLLPDLELWLELGVSVRTQLSLMELGMSRTAAIEIFELMLDDNMDKATALEWLARTDFDTVGVAELVKQEVQRVLERHLATGGLRSSIPLD